jgi:hypothetical protein
MEDDDEGDSEKLVVSNSLDFVSSFGVDICCSVDDSCDDCC